MATKFLARVYVGPPAVKQMAEKFRAAGVTVTTEGTEHVWVEVEATHAEAVGHNLAASLLQADIDKPKAERGLWGWIERNTQTMGHIQPAPAPAPCAHNSMVANNQPGLAWKCADCGHVYGTGGAA